MSELSDLAQNRWRSLLPMLGVSPALLDGKHHPCPVCGGKDRFRFTDRGGNGMFICNACGAGDGVKLLMLVHGWDFKRAAREVKAHLGEATVSVPKKAIQPEDQRKACLKLWKASKPIGDDMAAAYLIGRGFSPPWPAALRFVASCNLRDNALYNHLPAMIARVSDPEDVGVSVHRTYLRNGTKADIAEPRKLMAGVLPKGSAIRLSPVSEVLGIAEGIETALAVTRDHGVPCWSAINAQTLSDFIPPKGVKRLIIFGDNDSKFGGQKAAYALAYRLATQREPIEVEVKLPDTPGCDWDDIGKRLRSVAA